MATRAPKFRRGMSFTDLSAAEWQTIADGAVKAHNLTVSTPLTVKHGKDTATVGMVKQHDRRGGAVAAAGAVAYFKVVQYKGDYLECHTWDWVTEGNSVVHVAVPFLLRLEYSVDNPRAGYTYTAANYDWQNRTSTKVGGDTEEQVIVPLYLFGDVIMASRGIPVGVSVGEESIVWQDLNLDARAWAKESP